LTAPDRFPGQELRVEIELPDATVLSWDFGALQPGR
jgi:hypothetical protein